MANEIVSEIILDLDKMKVKLKEAEGLGANTGKKAGDGLGEGIEKGLLGSISPLKAVIAGLGAALVGAFSVKALVAAASESEDAVNSFNSALRVAGNLTPQVSQNFQDYAASLQRITTVSSDTVLSGAALLVSLGRLKGEGLEQATKASLDLAAGLNIDVNSAFSLVSRAAAGNVGALSRYGITVKATGDQAKDFATAMDLVSQKFGGLAESKVNTFSGAMAQLKNTFGDVLKEMGNMIIKSPVMISLIKFASAEFGRLIDVIKAFAGSGDIFGAITERLLQFGQALLTYVGAPVEFVFNIFQSLGQAIGGIASALVSLASGDFSQAMQTIKDTSTDTLETLFNFDSTVAASNYVARIQEVVELAKPVSDEAVIALAAPPQALPSLWDQVTEHVKAKLTEMANFVKMTSAAMTQGIQTFSAGLSRGFAQIGTNLASGGAAFKNFGKVMLGVLGDIAIQMGATFILMGLARVLLSYGADATGYALIAAGVGLSILGGALKGMSSGEAGVGGGAANTGAGLSSGGAGGEATPGTFGEPLPVEEQKPQTQVNVTVQGNVLDRRQAGLEIVEVINEAFGSQGLRFAQSS